jgi:predicted transcriptional regulator
MTQTDLTDAVSRALAMVPNVSALAKAANVSQSLLARIRAGERQATPVVANKVAAVLERWSAQYARAAGGVRQAQQQKGRR